MPFALGRQRPYRFAEVLGQLKDPPGLDLRFEEVPVQKQTLKRVEMFFLSGLCCLQAMPGQRVHLAGVGGARRRGNPPGSFTLLFLRLQPAW